MFVARRVAAWVVVGRGNREELSETDTRRGEAACRVGGKLPGHGHELVLRHGAGGKTARPNEGDRGRKWGGHYTPYIDVGCVSDRASCDAAGSAWSDGGVCTSLRGSLFAGLASSLAHLARVIDEGLALPQHGAQKHGRKRC